MTDLEAPEIDDLDESADAFKRLVALLVVGITFFGSAVAYLGTRAGNREDVAARQTQVLSTRALGGHVEAQDRYEQAVGVSSEVRLRQREQASAARRDEPAEAQRLADVVASLTALSPLTSDERYSEAAGGSGQGKLLADEGVGADVDQLRAAAEADFSGVWGAKADSYTAVLTVLAAALFLAGLSLVASGLARRFLIVPATGLTAVCVIWAGALTASGVDRIDDRAIKAVAEGNRLTAAATSEGNRDAARKDIGDAISSYDGAIKGEPGYATAYARRAEARFLAGSPQDLLSTPVFSLTDAKALKAAVADQEKALERGAGDAELLAGLGFNYFLAGRYDDSARLTTDALDANPDVAQLQGNLGVAELARGQREASDRAYRRFLGLQEKQKLDFARDALFSGARTDLEILLAAKADLAGEVQRVDELLTAAQTRLVLGAQAGDGKPTADARIEGLAFSRSGARVQADFTYRGVPAGAPVAAIWYYRGESAQPWQQQGAMDYFYEFADDGSGKGFVSRAPGTCPVPGEYRLDLYVAGRRLASGTGQLEPGPLGSPLVTKDDFTGTVVCRPDGWTVKREDKPGFGQEVTLANPDETSGLFLASYLLEAGDTAPGKAAVEKAALAGALRELGVTRYAPEPFVFGGVNGTVGIGKTKDADNVGMAVFLGSDNRLRLVGAFGDFAVTDELLATLVFTDLSSDDPGVAPTPDSGPSASS